jgi:hypothetical protein
VTVAVAEGVGVVVVELVDAPDTAGEAKGDGVAVDDSVVEAIAVRVVLDHDVRDTVAAAVGVTVTVDVTLALVEDVLETEGVLLGVGDADGVCQGTNPAALTLSSSPTLLLVP